MMRLIGFALIGELFATGRATPDVTRRMKAMFSLPPGAYRIEATLTGWERGKYSEAELTELAQMGNPFLEGEVPASTRVNLQ